MKILLIIPHAEPPATLGMPPYFEISLAGMTRLLNEHDIRVYGAGEVSKVRAMLNHCGLQRKPVMVYSYERDMKVSGRRYFAPIQPTRMGRAQGYIFWEETGQVHPLYD